MRKSQLEQLAEILLKEIGGFIPEHKFHDKRKWRFDFADVKNKIAVEIEGGVWSNGRHTRGSGFIADCEKYNEAVLLGWRVFRFTGCMIEDGTLQKTIKNMIKNL